MTGFAYQAGRFSALGPPSLKFFAILPLNHPAIPIVELS